jgi:hypothetical protein
MGRSPQPMPPDQGQGSSQPTEVGPGFMEETEGADRNQNADEVQRFKFPFHEWVPPEREWLNQSPRLPKVPVVSW